MNNQPTITIATSATHIRESLTRYCTTLGITTADDATIWLIDGHNTPALTLPPNATVLVIGPIPKEIIPTATIPTPTTLETLKDVLSKYLGTTSITLRGDWVFDAQQRSLSHANTSPISLTEKEAALLHALLQARPLEISRETLLKSIWAYDKEVDTHTVETHIYRLRQKCETATQLPFDIVTSEQGYKVVL